MRRRPSPTSIRRRLLPWFSVHRRDLPWRRTKDPYAILVSEIMLQQTQVDRVIPKYTAWLKTFPTVRSLARAPLSKVLKLWSGLGYNSRGMRLRELARVVVSEYSGHIPSDVETLEKLPGIGPYTARAIASFAFHRNEPAIDTNIRRVISRIFFGPRWPTYSKLKSMVDIVAPAGEMHTWNAALMDFGALVCQARRPKCEQCPVQLYCRAYPAILRQPVSRPRQRVRFETTDRFWRGRIVARLVVRSATTADMYSHLCTIGDISRVRFTKLVEKLVAENILHRTSSRLAISR